MGNKILLIGILTIRMLSMITTVEAQEMMKPLPCNPPVLGPKNVEDLFNLSAFKISIPPLSVGSTYYIFTVPTDKYLIITDFGVAANNTTTNLISLVEMEEGASLEIEKIDPYMAGNYRWGTGNSNQMAYHSFVGILFKPESQLGIKNGQGDTIDTVSYTVSGYLVEKE